MRNSEVLQLSVHKKYQGSNLIEEQRILLKKQLEQLIELQKPFLDPDLTLDQLSAAMKLHSKILSQVINQSYNLIFSSGLTITALKRPKIN